MGVSICTLDKATILRCASFHNGIRTSEIYTKSFFVGDDITEKYSIPVISLVTEGDNLFDFERGAYIPGVHYSTNAPRYTGNYFKKTNEWEKPVHIEYFESEGLLGFSQDAGLKIHGGKTRTASQKSLKLFAREVYGKRHFNYNLFPATELSSYDRFILRTPMGNWGNVIKLSIKQLEHSC